MITIRGLRMENWKCFRGVQEVELRDVPYALHARGEQDPHRSNWYGKSSVGEAIDYALHGRLPKECRVLADWVTRGEKGGSVRLRLSDGTEVVRSLKIGQSEQVRFWPSGDGVPAKQDEAQREVEARVGLTADDYLVTSYFRQRELAYLVSCKPEQRMELVAGWLQLAPIEQCEEVASQALSHLVKRREEVLLDHHVAQTLAASKIDEARALMGGSIGDSDFDLWGEVVEGSLRAARETLTTHEQAMVLHREYESLAGSAAEFDRVMAEGKTLAEKVKRGVAADVGEHERLREAAQKWRSIRDEAVRCTGTKVRIATGKFDGQCPLVGEACPSAPFVVGERAKREQQAEVAQQELWEAERIYGEAGTALLAYEVNLRQHVYETGKLDELRARAKVLRTQVQRRNELEKQVDPELLDKIRAAQEGASAAKETLERLRYLRDAYEEALKKVNALAGELVKVDGVARVAAAAAQVFGRQGAQRVIAEEALLEIEASANEYLQHCAPELSLRVQWSREGQGLAAACRVCGEAFPKSAKAKTCARCGGERGPTLVNKLEVVPSSRSGAADDLAGMALQLAASEWLRRDRHARWAVGFLDEPFAQMDQALRESFSAHLPRMLSRAGFAQAFVIAHHPGVLEALPARLVVERRGNYSTLRVE